MSYNFIMTQVSTKVQNCRICKEDALYEVINFGSVALTGIFIDAGDQVPRAPLVLCRCSRCGLVQLGHNYSNAQLYGETYGYESHLNSSMVQHLQQKARILERRYLANVANPVVVDIASNDGTLLSGYENKETILIGIDPIMDFISNCYPTNTVKIKNFFSSEEYFRNQPKLANLVTSLSVIYDLSDPISFAKQVNEILTNDGIWHFEQSYLPAMLTTNSYDTICHEHLLYLSINDIKNILEIAGFELISASLNNINGGSIAITAKKQNIKLKKEPFVNYLLENEIDIGILSGEKIKLFAKNYQVHSEKLKKLIYEYKDQGYDLIAFGASTKGNVLLQVLGLTNNEIRAIGEINPRKFGKTTPGSSIPIVSERILVESANEKTVALVLPWHFKDSLLKSLESYLSKGGKLLFPLPVIEEFSY